MFIRCTSTSTCASSRAVVAHNNRWVRPFHFNFHAVSIQSHDLLQTKNPVFTPIRPLTGTHLKPNKWKFYGFFLNIWPRCSDCLRVSECYSVLFRALFAHFIWSIRRSFGARQWISGFHLFVSIFAMFQTNGFYYINCYFSTHTVAKSRCDSNKPTAMHNQIALVWVVHGVARKTKGKVVCLVWILKSARKCHKFAFITFFVGCIKLHGAFICANWSWSCRLYGDMTKRRKRCQRACRFHVCAYDQPDFKCL